MAHKGTFGQVVVVGGNYGFAGAARLAAHAAARSGAGLVSVATRPEHVEAITSAVPEVMVRGINDSNDLTPLLERASAVVIGPGLGQDEWAQALLDVVGKWRGPRVLDADALNLLAAARPSFTPGQFSDAILTPHPAEAGRLLSATTKAVESDRFLAARELAELSGATIVLKGAGTLVAACERSGTTSPVGVCLGGNPGMATGGMGDVLSGILGGLLAQGMGPVDAARFGVCVHAAAADRAARAGERGMLAGDLIDELRTVLNFS